MEEVRLGAGLTAVLVLPSAGGLFSVGLLGELGYCAAVAVCLACFACAVGSERRRA